MPFPRSPPGAQEAQSAPDSPRPRAVRRLAQGAGFLEEIGRKSAGPLASGSPPNPAGARSSAAPLAAPGEGWEGGAGLGTALPPPGGGWGWLGCSTAEEGPLAQRLPISIYPPPPTTGGHVLHILGRLGAGGGVRSGDWWGTDGEPHPVYPLSSSAPKWGLWRRRQCPQGPAGQDGLLPQPSCCLFPPLVEEAGWSGELL